MIKSEVVDVVKGPQALLCGDPGLRVPDEPLSGAPDRRRRAGSADRLPGAAHVLYGRVRRLLHGRADGHAL